MIGKPRNDGAHNGSADIDRGEMQGSGYNDFLDGVGLFLILASWAVLPAVVFWWELTRRRMLSVSASVPGPNRTPSTGLIPFMPGAPLLALGVFVAGLVPTVHNLFGRWEVPLSFVIEVGLFSLGFWGAITTLASIIMWTHLPESDQLSEKGAPGSGGAKVSGAGSHDRISVREGDAQTESGIT